jgi:opacity protein-like surface antigen
LKSKLILMVVVVVALAGMAQAQGALSNVSVGVGLQGVFAGGTFDKTVYNQGSYPTTQSTTNSVGAVADARYDFGRHSAVGVAFSLNRNTEYFANSYGTVYHVQTNNGELIGTYIFRLPVNERVKPYAAFGGGVVRFDPNNDNNTGTVPSSSTKMAFAYGFGTDLKMTDHWGIRLAYRGLVRVSPNFKVNTSDPTETFGTNLKTHVAEPSIQLVYHF